MTGAGDGDRIHDVHLGKRLNALEVIGAGILLSGYPVSSK